MCSRLPDGGVFKGRRMLNTLRDFARDRAPRDWTVIDGGASGTRDKPVVVAALVRSAEVETAMREALAEDGRKVLRVKPAQNADLAGLRMLAADLIVFDVDVRN